MYGKQQAFGDREASIEIDVQYRMRAAVCHSEFVCYNKL